MSSPLCETSCPKYAISRRKPGKDDGPLSISGHDGNQALPSLSKEDENGVIVDGAAAAATAGTIQWFGTESFPAVKIGVPGCTVPFDDGSSLSRPSAVVVAESTLSEAPSQVARGIGTLLPEPPPPPPAIVSSVSSVLPTAALLEKLWPRRTDEEGGTRAYFLVGDPGHGDNAAASSAAPPGAADAIRGMLVSSDSLLGDGVDANAAARFVLDGRVDGVPGTHDDCYWVDGVAQAAAAASEAGPGAPAAAAGAMYVVRAGPPRSAGGAGIIVPEINPNDVLVGKGGGEWSHGEPGRRMGWRWFFCG
jgi:hypothetical protein